MRATVLMLLSIVVFGTGCVASTGRFRNLPPYEQDAFDRCTEPMFRVLCGRAHNGHYNQSCLNQNAAVYAEQPTFEDKKVWLVGHGCPPRMVDPERALRHP